SAIAPQAVGPAVRGLGAGVCHPGGDPPDAESAADRARPVADIGLSVAEPAQPAVAPAVAPVPGGHGAGEVCARVDLAVLAPADDGHRPGPLEHGGAVPELALVVRTPAERPVVRGHAAGVIRARADL